MPVLIINLLLLRALCFQWADQSLRALEEIDFKAHIIAEFVGLPDKLDIQPSSCLWMPPNSQAIPHNPKVLGVYATPNLNTLIPLFLVLFNLIFPASKA